LYYRITMRTTLNVDDDVLEIAKSLADVHRISLGRALSDLARRGLTAPVGTRRDPVSGLLVFDVPAGAPAVSAEEVQRAIDRDDPDQVLDSGRLFRNL
jgi:hypothetical protein